MNKFLIGMASWFPLSLYKAWVAMKLYNWHVSSNWNVNDVGFLASWGVITLLGLLFTTYPARDDIDTMTASIFSIIVTSMYLLFGFIITIFY